MKQEVCIYVADTEYLRGGTFAMVGTYAVFCTALVSATKRNQRERVPQCKYSGGATLKHFLVR